MNSPRGGGPGCVPWDPRLRFGAYLLSGSLSSSEPMGRGAATCRERPRSAAHRRPASPCQFGVGETAIEDKEYEHVCEIGLANPTGYQVGDTIYIKGRTDIRTGTEESTEFFNREQGHKVLFVEDYPHNDDGNGGRIWIEGHQYTKEHVVGGTRGAHTFDGAFVSK